MSIQQLGNRDIYLKFDDSYLEGLHAVQGETGRTYTFTLLDGEGRLVDASPYTLTMTVSIKGGINQSKAKGTSDGKFTVAITPDMIARYGRADVQLTISDNDRTLASLIGNLEIERNISFDDGEGVNLLLDFSKVKQALDSLGEIREEANKSLNETIEERDRACKCATKACECATVAQDGAKRAEKVREEADDIFSSEAKRKEEEAKRKSAESARVSGEKTRKSQESARQSAETQRKLEENLRKQGEKDRVEKYIQAEAERDKSYTTKENSRQNDFEMKESVRQNDFEEKESLRQSEEAKRKSAESTRQEAEDKRKSQEESRARQERTRESNEDTRKLQESERQSQEVQRQDAEKARVSAEDLRKEAEIERASTFKAWDKTMEGVIPPATDTSPGVVKLDKAGEDTAVSAGTVDEIKRDINSKAGQDSVDNVRSDLDDKVDKVEGKGLSTYDYDDNAKAKVDAIPDDPKYTDTVQDLTPYAKTSDLTPYAKKTELKTKLSEMTEDSAHRTVTDAEKNTWNSKVNKVNGKALSSNDFTNTHKSKLDNLTSSQSNREATTSNRGYMSASDKKKLDGIESGANKYTHPASHPISMISGLQEELNKAKAASSIKNEFDGKELKLWVGSESDYKNISTKNPNTLYFIKE